MELTHSIANQILTVKLEGKRLDAMEAPRFQQKVLELVQSEEANGLVVDLHKLQFIDSSGLGTFLWLLKALHARGGQLKLAGMSRPVQSIFELVGMQKVFEIYHSTDEALQSF
jgi:anti-anti-sigma factor